MSLHLHLLHPREPFLPGFTPWGPHPFWAWSCDVKKLDKYLHSGLVLAEHPILGPAALLWKALSRPGKRPTRGQPRAQPSPCWTPSQQPAPDCQSCKQAFLKVDPPDPVKLSPLSPAQIYNHDQVNHCVVLCLLGLRLVCHVAIDNPNRK